MVSMIKKYFFAATQRFVHTVGNPVRFLFKIFAGLKVEGSENLKKINKNDGVIFAANHASELDPVILSAIMNPFSRLSPLSYVARDKSFYTTSGWRSPFYGGALFKSVGAHPIIPGQKNYEVALAHHIKIVF